MATAEQILKRMDFPPSETGPYVTELREKVATQVAQGMTNRSGGSWAEECYERDENGLIVGWKISHEERARYILAMDWEVENAHSFRVEVIDPIIWRSFDCKTGKRSVRVRWNAIQPWLRDRAREFAMKVRVWRDRTAGKTNPYLSRK